MMGAFQKQRINFQRTSQLDKIKPKFATIHQLKSITQGKSTCYLKQIFLFIC